MSPTPNPLRTRAAAWAQTLEQVSTWAAGLCLGATVCVVLFGVVTRYGLGASPIWADELARYTLIWSVLLAGAAALRRGEHMQIDILVTRLPRGVARVVDGMRRVVILGVLLFMTIVGAFYAAKIWGMTTLALNVPRTLPTAAIPVGMGLMTVQFVLLQIGGAAARPTVGRSGEAS